MMNAGGGGGGGRTHPLTGQPLRSAALLPNTCLRGVIAIFRRHLPAGAATPAAAGRAHGPPAMIQPPPPLPLAYPTRHLEGGGLRARRASGEESMRAMADAAPFAAAPLHPAPVTSATESHRPAMPDPGAASRAVRF